MGADGIHLVFFFSFDERTRLRNEVRAEFRSFLIWGEERGMEDTMHLPSWWEAKAISIGRNNLGDFKRALLSRGQFSGGEIDLQVTGVEPYLRSYFPGGKFCSNLFFDCLSGFGMGSGSLSTSSVKEFESFIKGREERFSDQWVGSGFETHHERERHLIGDRVDGRVMRKLGHRQEV